MGNLCGTPPSSGPPSSQSLDQTLEKLKAKWDKCGQGHVFDGVCAKGDPGPSSTQDVGDIVQEKQALVQ